ncbi:quinone oxidoreductase family protein [Halalkalicoccus jeotgali]|uniref:NAD(P)H quinone oxidoreductase n=1 Tax=Halalkalicoccus jeotgali (strain DSM 18796 / CECT 7217 / JCM 14584 / KCTC 4019 / B3) TaxID=795797 RepID=L9VQR3_HALJB|nr:NADPH:quinone oxidoreductase family protein [Halalkalicoccus jeotgali]ELY39489.1 NAD(P)H quinone oxidoreductase [Halalkalicoccus jeotgali B3]
MNAITVSEFGDSDALETSEIDRPDPGEGEVELEVRAAGINFADVMQRRGEYPGGPQPPFTPGMEVAGIVSDAGGTDLSEGDRVVGLIGRGGYAEYAVADVEALFPIPEGMDFEEAAGFPVQYLTAHNCLFEWGGLKEGERVLIHAAAGGVGTAAVQLASRAGAEVFGTASTQEKLDLASDLSCEHPINYTEADLPAAVREITAEGLDLVLDGVGGRSFERSVESLAPFGRIVTYGVASGEPGRVETPRLFFGNNSVIGYHLGKASQQAPERVFSAVEDLTEGFASGELSVVVGETFALEEAADAHAYIENRQSSGKVVLVP